MARLLYLDASARPGRAGTHEHGSLTRRLTHHFVSLWQAGRPEDEVIYRDLGESPPSAVSGDWIHAAFTAEEAQEDWMSGVLAESDRLIDEVAAADILVLGVPMYNFNVPSSFKAWVDNIVRIGRTFDFDPSNPEHPYLPLMAGRRAVVLSSRGGIGLDPGAELAHMNHLEPSIRTALGFIGITELHQIAIEGQEFGGEVLADSTRAAEARVALLVDELQDDLALKHAYLRPEPA
ncbi:FMN-dependent NADH-azoreductase [Nitrincola sp. MINF-07-Sa-05]|uniref:FMN-dependent NADH-azoreductase n=1 Tax=Nitrincola salilacus TaxID=3400273 RepID=UPI003917D325